MKRLKIEEQIKSINDLIVEENLNENAKRFIENLFREDLPKITGMNSTV